MLLVRPSFVYTIVSVLFAKFTGAFDHGVCAPFQWCEAIKHLMRSIILIEILNHLTAYTDTHPPGKAHAPALTGPSLFEHVPGADSGLPGFGSDVVFVIS